VGVTGKRRWGAKNMESLQGLLTAGSAQQLPQQEREKKKKEEPPGLMSSTAIRLSVAEHLPAGIGRHVLDSPRGFTVC